MDLVDTLRTSAREVARRARSARPVEAHVEAYVETVRARAQQAPVDPGLMDVGDTEAKIAFVLTRDAINFGSGFHGQLAKTPGLSGARSLGWRLADHVRTHGPLSAAELATVRAQDCARLFHQDEASPVFTLMEMFAAAWNELGEALRRRYAGSFRALLDDAEGSAVRLVTLLGELPHWRDVSCHQGHVLPFMKRAQLTAYGLSLAAGPGTFTDLHRLTIFCDNLIPHVLRMDGLIAFSPALEGRIADGVLLEQGSPEEVEMRAAAVDVCERLVELCRARSDDIIAVQLASFLWKRGQASSYKAVPRPRIRTTFY